MTHPGNQATAVTEEPSMCPQDLPAAETSSNDTAKLKAALAVQKDDHLRLAADFDNFKKRTKRDSEQKAAAEKESFILDLLPVLDNLERALACGHTHSSEQLRQGVEMTLKQLDRLIRENGIEAFEEVGQEFNPHRHDAVSVQNDPGKPDHSVLKVIQRGYCRGDKVFRPAMVVVNDHSTGADRAG